MTEKVFTYCSGDGCSLTHNCLRYKGNLNKMKHTHFDPIPYDKTTRTCTRQLFLDGSNLVNSLDAYLETILNSENGNGENHRDT
jgi:hypothetical protein